MTEPGVEKPVRVRDWPRIWWHDEKFWRETATRTISGLLVVIIGYLGALALGLIKYPAGKSIIALVATIAVVVIVSVFFLKKINKRHEHSIAQWREGNFLQPRQPPYKGWAALGMTVVFLLSMVIPIGLIQWWARSG